MSDVTLEEATDLALRLSPIDKLRLVERLAATLEQELAKEEPSKPLKSMYGLLAHLGPAPSEEDIAEARKEMWGNFPREDLP